MNSFTFHSSLFEIKKVWKQSAATSANRCLLMFAELLASGNHQYPLIFDWVDGPVQEKHFRYEKTMPIIQPGLYSASYSASYGCFQRECVLIQHLQYEFPKWPVRSTSSGDDNIGEKDVSFTTVNPGAIDVWNRIRTDIFRNQADPSNIMNHIREKITAIQPTKIIFTVGKKVTGDPHVPMGKFTFGAMVFPDIGKSANALQKLGFMRDRQARQRTYEVFTCYDGWGTLAYPGCKLRIKRLIC